MDKKKATSHGSLNQNKQSNSPDYSMVAPCVSANTFIQYGKAIEMLELGNPSTAQMRDKGIYHPAGRIKELKERFGFDILTTKRIEVDQAGVTRSVGVYVLLARPNSMEVKQ